MEVFIDSGFTTERRLDDGVFHVILSLAHTREYLERAAERSETAATASMKAFFEPQTVAVIGASRERGKIGAEILHNLLSDGFTGRLFAVHPHATTIDGVPAVPRVDGHPRRCGSRRDLRAGAPGESVVDDCIAKGVKALVVITAGFARDRRRGAAPRGGARREESARAGIRMIGPNCMGHHQHRSRRCA